jgi:hypothetical protein
MDKFIQVKGTAIVRKNIDPQDEIEDVGLTYEMLEKAGEKINIVSANPKTQWYVSDDAWNWHVTWLKYIKLEIL